MSLACQTCGQCLLYNEGVQLENGEGLLESLVRSGKTRLELWLDAVDRPTLIGAAILVIVAVVLRKQLASWALSLLQALLKRFSVVLSTEVSSELKRAFEVLILTFVFFVATHLILQDGFLKTFLDRLLASVAIVAIFATWYELSGPFASLLRDEKHAKITMETDWIQRVTQFAIILFGLTSLLKVWEVDISGALTGVGVLGAGLAIATQDLLRNLVAGMSNISEQRFETGDAIEVPGQFAGTVKRIDLRSTLIIGFDQIPRHVPNADLSDSVVLNYSASEHRRIMLRVPLTLSSTKEQIEAVRDGLREYHRTCGDFALGDDAPKYIHVSDLGTSSVDIFIMVWTKGGTYDGMLEAQERLTLAILDITRKAGTSLAYPTQTLHLETEAISDRDWASRTDPRTQNQT